MLTKAAPVCMHTHQPPCSVPTGRVLVVVVCVGGGWVGGWGWGGDAAGGTRGVAGTCRSKLQRSASLCAQGAVLPPTPSRPPPGALQAQPGDLLTLCGLPGRRRAAFAIWPASSPTARQFAAFAAGAAPGSSGRRRSAAAESAEGEGSDAEEEWDSSQRDDASEEDGSVEESEEESGVENEPDSAGEAEGGGQPELAGQICQWLEVPAGSGQFCIRLTERVQAGVKLDLPGTLCM